MTQGFIIYSPYPSKEEARKAATAAVENKLACCVNIFDSQSIYIFEGKLNNDDESVCFFKTLPDKLADLQKFIQKSHPYTVPAIVTLEMKDLNQSYLNWAKTELGC